MSTEIINVAPQGDLVVEIGRGLHRKRARISSALIKYASPVFEAMLGPSFKEGQSVHDTSCPLVLPEDDATSTLSLFHILHYNSSKVNKSASDWLQRLVCVCDKYQCVSKVKEYIISHTKRCHRLSDIDILAISGLIKDECLFTFHALKVVRMTEQKARETCHQLLEPLLPADMLERMKEYRFDARSEYRHATHDLVAMIYNADAVQDFKLCVGLSKRLSALHEALFRKGVLIADVSVDVFLPDMTEVLLEDPFGGFTFGSLKCSRACKGCELSINDLAEYISEYLVLGSSQHCRVCWKCFQQREFNFCHECEAHTRPSLQT